MKSAMAKVKEETRIGVFSFMVFSLVSLLMLSCSSEQDTKTPEHVSQTNNSETSALSSPKNESSKDESAPVVVAMLRSPNADAVGKVRSFSAVLRGVQEANLTVKRPGRIVSIDVTLGERVVAGQTLVRLDSELEQLAVDAATARKESTEAGSKKAERDLKRAQELFAESGISESRLEAVRLNFQVAKAAYDGAQAELGVAKRHLVETRIVAPFDGEVSRLPFDKGETPPPSGIVAEVTDRQQLIADIFLSEEDALMVSVGMQSEISVVGEAKGSRFGTLRAVSPKGNEVTKLFKGEVVVNNSDLRLRSGVTCRVTFKLSNAGRPIVPASAVIEKHNENADHDGERFVAVVVVDSNVIGGAARMLRASFRSVVLGERVGSGVNILSGLEFGERIVVKGAQGLSDNQLLRALEEVSLDSLLN